MLAKSAEELSITNHPPISLQCHYSRAVPRNEKVMCGFDGASWLFSNVQTLLSPLHSDTFSTGGMLESWH